MNKEIKEKLTLLQLIKDKEKYEIKSGVKEELYIERLDATIVFEKPDKALALESVELTQDKTRDASEADIYLLYNSIVEPNLKDKELQEAFGCIEPSDIISKIFDVGEIPAISQEILKSAGYGSHIERVKQVKN